MENFFWKWSEESPVKAGLLEVGYFYCSVTVIV